MGNKNATIWGAVLVGLGVLFLLGQFLPGVSGFVGGLIATAIFVAMGVFFYTQYAGNRTNWGLLIPAYVMFSIAGLIALATLLPVGRFEGALIPAYVMFAIAAPFLYVYSRNTRSNWWALIPGGIMGTIGLGFLLAAMWQAVPVVLIVAGIYLLVRNSKSLRRGKAATNGHKSGAIEETTFEPIRMSGPESDE
jgi:predicted membrane protein